MNLLKIPVPDLLDRSTIATIEFRLEEMLHCLTSTSQNVHAVDEMIGGRKSSGCMPRCRTCNMEYNGSSEKWCDRCINSMEVIRGIRNRMTRRLTQQEILVELQAHDIHPENIHRKAMCELCTLANCNRDVCAFAHNDNELYLGKVLTDFRFGRITLPKRQREPKKETPVRNAQPVTLSASAWPSLPSIKPMSYSHAAQSIPRSSSGGDRDSVSPEVGPQGSRTSPSMSNKSGDLSQTSRANTPSSEYKNIDPLNNFNQLSDFEASAMSLTMSESRATSPSPTNSRPSLEPERSSSVDSEDKNFIHVIPPAQETKKILPFEMTDDFLVPLRKSWMHSSPKTLFSESHGDMLTQILSRLNNSRLGCFVTHYDG